LAQFVKDFAVAIQRADSRGPQAVGSRGGRVYQPGIGPHTESQTIRLVANELVTLNGAYAAHSFDVLYPGAARQHCDWRLGSPPLWDWAIEAKMLRLFGDNGELLSRPVDQDLLGGCGRRVLVRSFDEFSVDKGRVGADQGDEVRRVDGAPAVLG
jgi:hypothetical protein